MNKKNFGLKLAILLLNIFVVSSGATAATIPLMIKTFSNVNPTLVELTMTVSSLGIIVFTPISNILADKIGIKSTIISGLFIIISLFSGKEQQRLLGWSSVVQGLGMFLMTFLAGVLLNYGWHMAYWVNAVALPVLLMFFAYIPKNLRIDQENNKSEKPENNSRKINGKIWLLALFIFLFNSIFAFVSIKFATLVIEKGYGTAQDASTLLGIMSFAMAAGGFIYMALPQTIKNFSLSISIGCGLLAFFIFSVSNSLLVSSIGVILVGISVSMTMVSTMSSVGAFT